MNPFWWILTTIVGALISLIVSLIFSEPLKHALLPLITRTGVPKKQILEGRWVTTFTFREADRMDLYTEVIEIKTHLGMVVDRIVPDTRNHERLREIAPNKPLRLRGEFTDNRHFTGFWFHPLRKRHFHGAFQLLLDSSCDRMTGKWIGFRRGTDTIDGGDWTWERS
jgi:hypothetical protein